MLFYLIAVWIVPVRTQLDEPCYYFHKTLPNPLHRHQMVYFKHTNCVYLFGGQISKYSYSNNVYKWNVSNRISWFKPIGTTPTAQFSSYTNNAVIIDNRYVYFIGMQTSNSTQRGTGDIFIFDTQIESFINNSHVSHMPYTTVEGGLATNNSHIFYLSGYIGKDWCTLLQIYNIRNNEWYIENITTASELSNGFKDPFCKMVDNELFLFGPMLSDATRSDSVYKYQFPNKWTYLGKLSVGRTGGAMAYYNSNIYIIGGYRSTTARSNIIDVFDVNTETIQNTSYNMIDSIQTQSALIISNRLFIFGGSTAANTVLSSIQVCNLTITIAPTINPSFNQTTLTNPSISPTKNPIDSKNNTLAKCINSKYVGGLSGIIYIYKDYDVADNNSNSMDIQTADLIKHMQKCENNMCDVMFDIGDNVTIYYNKNITFYCCITEETDHKSVFIKISSAEFTNCIDKEIDDDTTTLIDDIHIWLKNIHKYVKFVVANFTVFVVIFITMGILFILTFFNWLHSKGSYCICCCCAYCGCMAADQANISIMFVTTLRIGDLVTDCVLLYYIHQYYCNFNTTYKVLLLMIVNTSSLILPYFIVNIWTMISVTKLNMKNDRLREWFQKYIYIILFVVAITGDGYVSLLLFTSNLFGISLFDSGLSSWHLRNLKKFKMMTIIFENIPQVVTQIMFAFYTKNFAVVTLSLIFSFSLNIINIIAWTMSKNFDKTCVVCDYYIEVKVCDPDTFDNDLSKIRNYSKCRNRLRDKLVDIIRENTSNTQFEVYYVELIGTGCNIHIIHYLSANTKIRTSTTGSVPVSDSRISMNIDAIMTGIYKGKYESIEEQLKALWHLDGEIIVELHYCIASDDNLPSQANLQLAPQNSSYDFNELAIESPFFS